MHHGGLWRIVDGSLAARMADLLGRAERSSPEAAQRRAAGAGLDGESAHRAIIWLLPRCALVLRRTNGRFGRQFAGCLVE